MIVIDSNEPLEIVAHIMDRAPCKREDLSIGDYLVGDYIIERKEMNDFVGRMTEEKISVWRQLDAVAEQGARMEYEPVLVMEGSFRSVYANVPDTNIVGALASCLDKGVSVVHTPRPEATAQLMVTLDDDGDHDVHSVRQSPSISAEERPQHILEGLPEVGPERAVAMLDEFGSVRNVMTASAEKLTAVDGIGTVTAQKIVDSLR